MIPREYAVSHRRLRNDVSIKIGPFTLTENITFDYYAPANIYGMKARTGHARHAAAPPSTPSLTSQAQGR